MSKSKDIHGIPVDGEGRYYPGNDYYEWYSKRTHAQKLPNVSLIDYRQHLGSWAKNDFLWFIWCIIVGVMNRFSAPRMDHTFNLPFWRAHWLFLSIQWVLYLVTFSSTWWVPAVYGGGVINTMKEFYEIVLPPVVLSQIIYMGGIWWGVLNQPQKFKAMFTTTAKALQYWELTLWIGWLLQMVAFNMVMFCSYYALEPLFGGEAFVQTNTTSTPIYEQLLQQLVHGTNTTGMPAYQQFLQHPATIVVGLLLTAVGFVVKSYVVYLSGVNNYYYYDMVLGVPNERFVDSSLYKYVASPTYMIGYLDGFGGVIVAGGLIHNGSPTLGLIWMAAQYASIIFNDHFVEQPSVRRMYSKGQISDDEMIR